MVFLNFFKVIYAIILIVTCSYVVYIYRKWNTKYEKTTKYFGVNIQNFYFKNFKY